MRTRRALVVCSVLFGLGTATVGPRVHGSDERSTPCRETAPWVLEGSISGESKDAGFPAPTLDVATYTLHSGLGQRHAFFRRRELVERDLRAIARSIAAASPD